MGDILSELKNRGAETEDALEAFEDVEKQYRLFCEVIQSVND